MMTKRAYLLAGLLVSFLATATSCTEIPEGQYVCDEDAQCPDGWICRSDNLCWEDEGEACAAGSYDDDNNTGTPCVTCDAGNYCAGGGATPELCAVGTHDDDMSAATACVACSAGTFCAGGSSAPTTCTDPDIDHDNDPSTPCQPPDFSCTAGEFDSCDSGNAQFCNATGDGLTVQSCGAPGCNDAAKRCNTCAPSEVACDGDVLESCDADGMPLADESCLLSCKTEATPHCAYLEPKFLPDVCDSAATEASLVIEATQQFDTRTDLLCTGGIVAQVDGPEICVVRHADVTVQAGKRWTFIGTRAVAIVADGDIDISGVLDLAGEEGNGGPGSLSTNAEAASSSVGGGGAGHRTNGGNGGGALSGGGKAVDNGDLLAGGYRGGGNPPGTVLLPSVVGGGGGGALTLISCRGKVSVSGAIDAGGGGGAGGAAFGLQGGGATSFRSGGGGGSGGYVVLQGLAVEVTGGMYANGGGGGGGGGVDARGNSGADGYTSTTNAAAGGTATVVGGAAGGVGGYRSGAPKSGGSSTVNGGDGGGGGSVGRFRAFTPAGVTPVISDSKLSPTFDAAGEVPTR